MKLLIIIVNNDDAKAVAKSLVKNKFYSTKLASTGNFLLSGSTTMLVGCQDDEVEKVINIIKSEAHQREKMVTPVASMSAGILSPSPIEVTIGGATIFIINVEQFVKL